MKILCVVDQSDRNSRAVKVALLRQMPQPPTVLILGNSRSMELAPQTVEEITGLRAFNAASAAGLS